ncbi:unnamed protein product [Rotaria sp. Silwood1]|nr:unnamed protein product [Rotaria sp. Silwood1]CAF1326128.1 unnamed protein product [Rotaria sp. Silwood1]
MSPVFIDGLPYNPVNGEGIFTTVAFLCGQQARGTVRLSFKDPTSKPIIDHAYLDNDLDVAVLAEGCRLCHEIIMKGRGTKDIIVGAWPKIVPHPNDMIGWKEHVRAFASTCFHPGGTCKMAPDNDPMGVVDSRLRVRNVKGLRVADVSILPLLNNGHPQILAYAIGEKAASLILEDDGVSNAAAVAKMMAKMDTILLPPSPPPPPPTIASPSIIIPKGDSGINIADELKGAMKVILLKNMVGPGEVDDLLDSETKEECQKYGEVDKCLIYEIPEAPEDEAVRIFDEFKRVESAIKAVVAMNGRYFGGRVVKAKFYNFDKFRQFDLADDS